MTDRAITPITNVSGTEAVTEQLFASPSQRQLDAAVRKAAKAAARSGLRLSGLTVGGMSLTFGAPPSSAPNGNDQLDRWIEKHASETQGH
jgi:hypothetical protein